MKLHDCIARRFSNSLDNFPRPRACHAHGKLFDQALSFLPRHGAGVLRGGQVNSILVSSSSCCCSCSCRFKALILFPCA